MTIISQKTTLVNQLRKITNECGQNPTVFISDREIITISAEDGRYFADYYGEFKGGDSWIHPKLVQWAKDRNGYWEWENPGCIGFYE